jgi:hypothetical protein
MSTPIVILIVVAPLYIWALLHIHKSKTTWSRFEIIEHHILRLTNEVWRLESKPNAKTKKRRTNKKP